MAEHWCDRGGERWPLDQFAGAKLDMDRPVMMAGAVYAHAAGRASEGGAYTRRTRFYALAWHAFRAGPDPGDAIRWTAVRPHARPMPCRAALRRLPCRVR